MQNIIIYIDDSGKLTPNEEFSCFGGLVFLDNDSRRETKTKYRSVISDISKHYKKGVEIKSSSIRPSHRRRVMNLLYQEFTFGVCIHNKSIHSGIMESKHSRGRYEDYAQKRIIKTITKRLISNKLIDPNKAVRMTIISDQHTTASDGKYPLRESIIEELKYGISNYNYGVTFNPILFSDFELAIHYKDSKIDIGVQMADFVAGSIRSRHLMHSKDIQKAQEYVYNKITVFLKLP